MAKKQMLFKTKGMNKDLSVSAFNPEFSFDNMNLRLSTNENNTLLSWVNEKGTQAIDGTKLSIDTTPWVEAENNNNNRYVHFLYGIPIGTAVLNNQLVVFTHSDKEIEVDEIPLSTLNGSENEGTQVVYAKDFIYVLWYNKNGNTPIMEGKLIFRGYLGFSTSNPLETIVSYESEFIQKVYWVDGVKQPRVINIAANKEYLRKWNKGDEVIHNSEVTAFNFVMNLKLEETVKIKKVTGGNGQFPAGVIQYAFTYYNKNGQESAIFYTSPLLYVSPKERGAAQDEKVDNIFQIKVSNVDTNYDYLRIYSLERTSLNAVPIAKRVQDIKIDPERDSSEYYTFTDTGYSGDSIDPTELLYKGGEFIIAKTMEQKDGTLFLGNLTMERESIENTLKEDIANAITLDDTTRSFDADYSANTTSLYKYANTLSAYIEEDDDKVSVPCGGFKYGDYYRCGVQFQHKTGKWSDPIFLEDFKIGSNYPEISYDTSSCITTIPAILGILDINTPSNLIEDLVEAGYKKIRPVVVFPQIQDRVALCQGVVCPSMFREKVSSPVERYTQPYAQSSWFFRPVLTNPTMALRENGTYSPFALNVNPDPENPRAFTPHIPDMNSYSAPTNIKAIEVQGIYEYSYGLDGRILTLHSPDLEFDSILQTISFDNIKYKDVGHVSFTNTYSDIDIQTESPTIDSAGAGFGHKSFAESAGYGIGSGLFYDDKVVDDNEDFVPYSKIVAPSKWMVYVWNKNGSLNNDVTRPSGKGTPSAVLKKKIISNLRYAITALDKSLNTTLRNPKNTPQVFNSDDVSLVILGSNVYMGNIDTLLSSKEEYPSYFAFNCTLVFGDIVGFDANFEDAVNFRLYKDSDHARGMFKHNGTTSWEYLNDDIGDDYSYLSYKKDSVRMKYKSTPHLVFEIDGSDHDNDLDWGTVQTLPIVEFKREETQDFLSNIFGGESMDALKANVWIPCGEPVRLDDVEPAHWYKIGEDNVPGAYTDEVAQYLGGDGEEMTYNNIAEAEADGWKWIDDSITFQYSYGDTYFQRWDCLKTYPFSSEDVNQVVEIGSFMLESHVNADGRYDRNRGMTSNLYMTPQNFNRFNPVYSQVDNFFSYRIQDEDFYKDKNFPNQLTWSKTKTSGADVDLWTNITLASVLELDGDKGEIQKLIRLNDQLLAFQDTGISQVLYNDNVQISSTDGVPIEIANSGKVSGKRYLSNTIGCANKWSMTNTPNGIYFMDSINKDIFMFNGQLNNLSQQYGFNTWAKDNIIGVGEGTEWNPKDFKNFVTYYDKLNQDVLFINSEKALAWSERLGTFTSFYDYGETPFFCNLEDTGVWLKPVEVTKPMPEGQEGENPSSHWECRIWRHQTGDYCNFFGNSKPYWMTLVGNPEPQTDKVFTNLEFRACVDGDGTPSTSKDEDDNPVKFTPSTPFDSVETWNEYQHGYTALSIKNGHSMFQHGGSDSALIRKFRIWRCDIPRNNCNLGTPAEGVTWPYSTDAQLRVSRYVRKPQDRMRNPWLYLKLQKNAAGTDEVLDRAEIHDLVMTYFN